MTITQKHIPVHSCCHPTAKWQHLLLLEQTHWGIISRAAWCKKKEKKKEEKEDRRY